MKSHQACKEMGKGDPLQENTKSKEIEVAQMLQSADKDVKAVIINTFEDGEEDIHMITEEKRDLEIETRQRTIWKF